MTGIAQIISYDSCFESRWKGKAGIISDYDLIVLPINSGGIGSLHLLKGCCHKHSG
jgi:hypothetical protein